MSYRWFERNQLKQVTKLELSPLSVSYFVDKSVARKQIDAMEVVILLKDGRKINMNDFSIKQTKKGWNVRCAGGYLDEKKILAIEINGQTVNISEE